MLNSRSYGGTISDSDHKLVKANIEIKLYYIPKSRDTRKLINLENFNVKDIKEKCKNVLDHKYNHEQQNSIENK